MANEFKVKKGLIVDGSNTVLDIQGTQGQLFSVTDSLTGDLFSVSDVSGIPIFNVNSSGSITTDGSHLTILDGHISLKQSTDSGFTTGLTIERSANTQKLHIGMDGGAVNFNSPDGLAYKFRNNGTEKFTVDGSGNATFVGDITVNRSVDTSSPVITVSNDDSKHMKMGVVRSAAGTDPNTSFIAYDGDFRLIPGSGNSTEKFTLNSSGNATFAGKVGVGLSPSTSLHVSGSSLTNKVAALIGGGWVGNDTYHKEGGLLLISGTNDVQTGAGIAFQTRNTQNTNYWKSSIIMDRDGAIRFTLGGAGTIAGSNDFTILSGGNAIFAGNVDVDGGTLNVGSSNEVSIVSSGSSLFPSLKVNNNGYVGSASVTDALKFLSSGDLQAKNKIGVGVDPTTLLHLHGTGDAIRVESTNTGAGGAQVDLLHFTTSPADEDTHASINMGGYYTGTTSVYGTQIKSIWTDVSERHSRLEFTTCDTTVSTALTLAHDNSATFAGDVKGATFNSIENAASGGFPTSKDYLLAGTGDRGGGLIVNDISGARHGITAGGYDLTFSKETNNGSGTLGQDIWMRANATDAAGGVTSLEFFKNASFTGSITAGGDITATGADFTLAHAAGATVYLRRDDTSISDGNVLGLINFEGDDPTDDTFNTGVALMGRAAGDWASGSYESEFILQTRNTSGGLVTALTVNEEQKVGIGQTEPSQLLHVGDGSDATRGIISIEGAGGQHLIFSENSGFSSANAFCLRPASGTDFIIQQDGNSAKALTIDTSANATFAGDITQADGKRIWFRGSSASTATGGQSYIHSDGLNLKIKGDDNVKILGDGGGTIAHFDYTGNTSFNTTQTPIAVIQSKAATFSGANGVHANSRLGIMNNGSLTSIVNASTYNDPTYPDYGLVFIQGPSTSNYNVWSISPDGPAKGSDLNFIFKANTTNIHTQAPVLKLHGSTSSATLAGDFNIDSSSAAGSTVLDVQGTAGQLFSVTNSLSGDLFSVSDVSGIPIFNVNSSGLVEIDGDLNLGDTNKIQLGDSQDLHIFHDGSNSFIRDNGTGGLVLEGSTMLELKARSGEIYLRGNENSSVQLYHNNNIKLNTSSVGVDVTGSLTASGDVVAYSDERLKTNIETLDGSKVYDMRGVSFTKNNKKSSGVIAQELEKIAPELVNNNSEFKAVAYGNITGYLIEAIKELKAEIEELKKQIK